MLLQPSRCLDGRVTLPLRWQGWDMDLAIRHDPDNRAFTALADGREAGALYYRVLPRGGWDMFHTLVRTEYEGRGVGSALVAAAVRAAAREQQPVAATCWFVAGWLQRHPDALVAVPPDDSDAVANRDYWDARAHEWVSRGEANWAAPAPNWGLHNVPEEELRLLPESLAGSSSIELGCGTAYVSAWLVRRGAQAVALDNSERQLATARRLSADHGMPIRFVHGDAQRLPFEDESFDFAITEYGAVTWCDPHRWVAEAARVLRVGSRMVVLGGSPWLTVCTPIDGALADTWLHRDYFGLGRVDWREVEFDPGGVSHDLPVSEWFALFAGTGFRVERFLEIQAPEGSGDSAYVTAAWARRFPAEQAWVLTRVAG